MRFLQVFRLGCSGAVVASDRLQPYCQAGGRSHAEVTNLAVVERENTAIPLDLDELASLSPATQDHSRVCHIVAYAESGRMRTGNHPEGCWRRVDHEGRDVCRCRPETCRAVRASSSDRRGNVFVRSRVAWRRARARASVNRCPCRRTASTSVPHPVRTVPHFERYAFVNRRSSSD